MNGIDLKDVRLVSLHFSFSNPDLIPDAVPERDLESPVEWGERTSRVRSQPLLGPAENTSPERVLEDLGKAGYELVDAWSQTRRHQDNSAVLFYVVRFTFAHQQFATPSNGFRIIRVAILPQLSDFCASASWTTEAFVNPFLVNGQKMPNQQVVRIVLKGRKPLLDKEGNPILAWRKDGNGRRIGEAPVPLQPDSFLCIEQNGIRLVRSR